MHKNKGKISIVMPFYKAEAYVERMVKAVQAQTYTDWELVAVSNGPQQEKQNAIVSKLAKEDARIKLICTDEPGVSNARNIGIAQSTGKWLTFVDADDDLTTDHLQRFIDAAEEDTDMVCGGYTHIWEKQNRITKSNIPLEVCENPTLEKLIVKLDSSIKGSPCTKMYKTAFVKAANIPYPQNMTCYEDFFWNYQIFQKIGKIALIPQTGYLYHYAANKGSANSKYHANFEESKALVRAELIKLYKIIGLNEEEINDRNLESLYVDTYFSVRNLFCKGCPLSFIQKVKRVKADIYDNPTVCNAIEKRSKCNVGNYALIMFEKLYRTKSPFILTLGFATMLYIKRMLNK